MKNVSMKIILIESSLPKLSFKLNLVQKLPLQAELLKNPCRKIVFFSQKYAFFLNVFLNSLACSGSLCIRLVSIES